MTLNLDTTKALTAGRVESGDLGLRPKIPGCRADGYATVSLTEDPQVMDELQSVTVKISQQGRRLALEMHLCSAARANSR